MEKKSFLMYLEYEEQLSDLSDEELGMLLRAIFQYEKDGTEPNLAGLLKMAFSFIKGNLNRDRNKYDRRCETSAINGAKGGRPKNEKPNSKPNEKPKKPKTADIDNEIDNDNDNDTDIDIDNDIVIDNDNEIDMYSLTNFFEKEFGQLISSTVYQKLIDYQKIFDNRLIKQAIKECVYANVRTMNYLDGVLKNWKGEGITTYAQWKIKQQKIKEKRLPVDYFEYDWLNEEKEND